MVINRKRGFFKSAVKYGAVAAVGAGLAMGGLKAFSVIPTSQEARMIRASRAQKQTAAERQRAAILEAQLKQMYSTAKADGNVTYEEFKKLNKGMQTLNPPTPADVVAAQEQVKKLHPQVDLEPIKEKFDKVGRTEKPLVRRLLWRSFAFLLGAGAAPLFFKGVRLNPRERGKLRTALSAGLMIAGAGTGLYAPTVVVGSVAGGLLIKFGAVAYKIKHSGSSPLDVRIINRH
ncbi:MAG: DUF533 domain-containing protein [Candidatus Diapherotrites archaeon]|nr:DUF533 domain-containing protein [Candidatus Diapherotrites archaeon]